ncbi:hypothetical protein IB642_06010 [Allofrancisella guangzhouensis]|uniref:Fe2OG dioxygenase domain-containing protein n=1 Tax=Allofrancisella guangzhouensis TaxID=594679 RepID=A0A0A8E2M2_9GAMM|nr:hypothetical protein [Allofrancisella guangzhouensis]AJC48238.1 hypothetical protein SD28_00440 [Allofrancisella guangzhouensis]MBK2027450.1 hypothetical protein [Allofrancisella guangzhouensis]MBK2044574.1 hypothetical protein [Allofrancisella guangzhouensis]MBK2046452.1 hypothetical protein [Allofrancisella guangzhouensis]
MEAIYHSILPIIQIVTCADAIVSPYPVSDINIKAYPAGGGALGLHYDTNGITVLLSLLDNTEAPLRAKIPRSHPSRKQPWLEDEEIYASAGDLLIMQGRKILHDSAPTRTQKKYSVIYNYYESHDVYRHHDFDQFVYYGKKPEKLEG